MNSSSSLTKNSVLLTELTTDQQCSDSVTHGKFPSNFHCSQGQGFGAFHCFFISEVMGTVKAKIRGQRQPSTNVPVTRNYNTMATRFESIKNK